MFAWSWADDPLKTGMMMAGQESLHWSEQAKANLGGTAPPALSLRPPLEKKRVLSWMSPLRIVIALVIIFVVAGGGYFVLHMHNSARAASGASTVYHDGKTGFSLTFPKGWVKSSFKSQMPNKVAPTSQVAFGEPDKASTVGLGHHYIRVAAVKSSAQFTEEMLPTMAAYLDQYLAVIGAQVAGFKVLEASSQVTVNGVPGVKAEYSATLGSEAVTADLYLLASGNITYQIDAQTPSADWEKYKPALDAAVASFQVKN
jgi:hypothetical protein